MIYSITIETEEPSAGSSPCISTYNFEDKKTRDIAKQRFIDKMKDFSLLEESDSKMEWETKNNITSIEVHEENLIKESDLDTMWHFSKINT